MNVISNLFKKITELINVKSIITIAITIVFCVASIKSNIKISSEQFLTIFTVLISFYFGVQSQREKSNNDNSNTTK